MTLSVVHLEAEDCGVASVSATASNHLLQEESKFGVGDCWSMLEGVGGLTAFEKKNGGWNKVGQCFLEKFQKDIHRHTNTQHRT